MTHILQIGMGWVSEEPGGLNRMYAGLLRGLAGCSASVRGLVAGSEPLTAPPPSTVSFFERREASALKRLTSCRRRVGEALRREPIDVVAAHFSFYALPVLDLLRDQRFVFHFHGPWAEESRVEGKNALNVAVKHRIESLVYRRADRLITLSSAFADLLVRRYGIDRERIFVVPGGVDVSRYAVRESREQSRDLLGLPQNRPLILTVRRLMRRMGLEGLIDAMLEVREAIPEALLLIAGVGDLRRELEDRILENELEDHVLWLGFVAEEDLPRLYRACDLSIVPSAALEGFGLSAIESLATGTPVLVTPVGGLPEAVRALDPSLIMPDATVKALSRSLRRALRSPGSLPSAERCARYARERFDWSVIARQVLRAYES